MSIALRDVNWETQADIFRLAEELKLDSDRLLSVIEGCELLGFAMVAQGDVSLTPLGQTFGESERARAEGDFRGPHTPSAAVPMAAGQGW
ncbi:MAG TPA: AAA-associated domain-containing protein [Bryobacteraceae bacterium]|nr:AAA-associated domain-containing protein [Bryobacteraceae bacterium]